ncbi:hypothetical protein KC351_g4450 [Hortaea werneckii]|nr:hypothetical protein KC351_g4450 [Hortaea werneckii]
MGLRSHSLTKAETSRSKFYPGNGRENGKTKRQSRRYVEWEKYPEKKAKAHKILTSQNFPPNPEFQLGPLSGTNPVLPGTHWKMWHTAIGGELTTVAEDSWATVLREKHPEMLHLLQFPYNGEPPKRLTTAKPITPNNLHFVRNHYGIPIIDEEKFSLDVDGLSKEYLYFNQQVGKHNQRPTDGIQIQEMPVSSAIMSPWQTQVVIHTGKIHCKGWAYSGGGRWPERVELSADGGFSWYAVPLENLSSKGRWRWRTWEMDLPCDVEGWIEIVCRTWDNSLNTQPLSVRAAWNWGLHVTSSAHRVKVYSINKKRPLTAHKLELFEKTGSPLAPITWPEEFVTQGWDEYKRFWAEHEPRDVDD